MTPLNVLGAPFECTRDTLEGARDTLEGTLGTLESPLHTLEGTRDTLEGTLDTLEGSRDTHKLHTCTMGEPDGRNVITCLYWGYVPEHEPSKKTHCGRIHDNHGFCKKRNRGVSPMDVRFPADP